MNSGGIIDKWNDKTLTPEDILAYLDKNIFPTHEDKPTEGQASALADSCYALYAWSNGLYQTLGHFLTAVKDNDWAGICDRGDGTNTRFHWVYRMFLYNCAPKDWRERRVENGHE